MKYTRNRRLRSKEWLRDMVSETRLNSCDYIQPIFVDEGISEPVELTKMPGIFRIPETQLRDHVSSLIDGGVRAIILFGYSHTKDAHGNDAMSEKGLLARMIRASRAVSDDLIVVADTCFCEYTDHGHCGILTDGIVDNDRTIQNLGIQAKIAASEGADIIAPSSMMDGQVRAIRAALDDADFINIPIMSYSTKYQSSFYGPFREAGGSSLVGTRDTYMLDHRNSRLGLKETLDDVREGADIVMVKPGLLYLDMITRVRDATNLPVCSYHISGEYSMLKFAAMAGAIDESSAIIETMNAFKRAGADMVISYYTADVVRLIHSNWRL